MDEYLDGVVQPYDENWEKFLAGEGGGPDLSPIVEPERRSRQIGMMIIMPHGTMGPNGPSPADLMMMAMQNPQIGAMLQQQTGVPAFGPQPMPQPQMMMGMPMMNGHSHLGGQSCSPVEEDLKELTKYLVGPNHPAYPKSKKGKRGKKKEGLISRCFPYVAMALAFAGLALAFYSEFR